MGFLFSFIGAIAGLWFMSEGRAFFGLMAGMLIGWLLARVLQAQITIRSLVDRVDNLEQRNRAMSAIDRAETKIKVPPATPAQRSVEVLPSLRSPSHRLLAFCKSILNH